jgi:hypothetical protein
VFSPTFLLPSILLGLGVYTIYFTDSGIYGLSPLTGWEDILLFDHAEASGEELGYTCICTKAYLGNGMEDLEDDPDEAEFVEQIKEYLNDNTIHYHYCFDNPSSNDFFELPYNNLPLNELGVKPRYVEMWHPNEGIDLQVIDECVREFCLRFLDTKVIHVHHIDPVSIDKAVQTYDEHRRRFSGKVEFEFTDDLIQDMMRQLGKTEEEVKRILKASINN